MKRIAASLIILAATSSAYALEFTGEMYVVGSIGRVGVNQTEVQVQNNNSLNGATVSTVPGLTATLKNLQSAQSSSRNGYKLQLGYEFTPHLAIEGGYIDLGKTEYTASYTSSIGVTGVPSFLIPPLNVNNQTVTRSSTITGWNIAGVGIIPVNVAFSVFGKLGMIDAKVKSSTSGSGTNAYFSTASDDSGSKWKGYFGAGAVYYPNRDRNFGIRAEYERFSKVGTNTSGSTDVNLMTVGLSTKF